MRYLLDMPRIARIVEPNTPYHVTQRGNRRQQTFFSSIDYEFYLNTLKINCESYDTELWAYCLMPNHVHLLLFPKTTDGLRFVVGNTHEAYTRRVNLKHGWKGYLWQGRFASFALDDLYLANAIRYIELNPVRANICARPQDYKWSSTRGHLGVCDDPYIDRKRMLSLFPNWSDFLGVEDSENIFAAIRKNSRSGRPLGTESFLKTLEEKTGLNLLPKKHGR